VKHENLRGTQVAEHFDELGACEPAMDWLWDEMPPTLRDAIQTCEETGWLLWAAAHSPLFVESEAAIEAIMDAHTEDMNKILGDKSLGHTERLDQCRAARFVRRAGIKEAMLACITED